MMARRSRSWTRKMSDEMMATIIEGLGGADNIQHVDACFTRLRVKVKDKALVMPDTDWKQKTVQTASFRSQMVCRSSTVPRLISTKTTSRAL